MERLEIEKESLKARLEIDERSEGVISSQSARGAPTVAAALGCSFPFCSLRNLKKVQFEEFPKAFSIKMPNFYQKGSTPLSNAMLSDSAHNERSRLGRVNCQIHVAHFQSELAPKRKLVLSMPQLIKEINTLLNNNTKQECSVVSGWLVN
jgi:hypothetical protein